ncbi:MAG: hypothetical protein H6679_05930 [Epsilonproteobacteria bacterium]|nr:hypothetical protein [Campylobacterota bacterium]
MKKQLLYVFLLVGLVGTGSGMDEEGGKRKKTSEQRRRGCIECCLAFLCHTVPEDQQVTVATAALGATEWSRENVENVHKGLEELQTKARDVFRIVVEACNKGKQELGAAIGAMREKAEYATGIGILHAYKFLNDKFELNHPLLNLILYMVEVTPSRSGQNMYRLRSVDETLDYHQQQQEVIV